MSESHLQSLTSIELSFASDVNFRKAIAHQLLNEYNIEIGSGLGELAGQVWSVDLMGFNSRTENIDRLLEALRQVLHK